jgi:hypothetical protein
LCVQIREIADRTLQELARDSTFEVECRQWIDCFLLGLYGHCETSPSSKRMLEYYEMIRDPARHRHFHHWLLLRQDPLCCFIIRAYLIFLLPFQPCLERAMQQTCQWDVFVRVCVQVSRQLHANVDAHGWSILLLGEPPGPRPGPRPGPLRRPVAEDEKMQDDKTQEDKKATGLRSGHGEEGRTKEWQRARKRIGYDEDVGIALPGHD